MNAFGVSPLSFFVCAADRRLTRRTSHKLHVVCLSLDMLGQRRLKGDPPRRFARGGGGTVVQRTPDGPTESNLSEQLLPFEDTRNWLGEITTSHIYTNFLESSWMWTSKPAVDHLPGKWSLLCNRALTLLPPLSASSPLPSGSHCFSVVACPHSCSFFPLPCLGTAARVVYHYPRSSQGTGLECVVRHNFMRYVDSASHTLTALVARV
jgi:hypothetical protein